MPMKEVLSGRSNRLFNLMSGYIEKEKKLHMLRHIQMEVPWMAFSHGEILGNLYAFGDQTMSNMATLIRKDPSTVTTLVKRLKVEKMLDSHRSLEDNRKWVLSLTDKGREHCIRIEKSLSKETKEISEAISEEDFECIAKILEKGSIVLDYLIENVENI